MRHRLTFCEKLIRCLACGQVFTSVEEGMSRDCPIPLPPQEGARPRPADSQPSVRPLNKGKTPTSFVGQGSEGWTKEGSS
jgi:hypothetical protein